PGPRWRVGAVGAVAAALALVVALVVALGVGRSGTPAAPPAALGWGVTHTQYSAADGDPATVGAALDALSARSLPQNQHIMGWGADNPEPAPGRYDFTSLDERMRLVRRTGGTPVITLCCAPDWMKGGTPGRTDWSRRSLEKAPGPEHYGDFADLAATVARRYPYVRYFLVWNEFKGFFDDAVQRWDYEGYTRFYNGVYRALKGVDARNRVGGPYLNMDSLPPGSTRFASGLKGPWGSVDQRVLDAFGYWNRKKAGADFVVVDGSSSPRGSSPRPDAFGAVGKFTAVGRWLRQRTSLPLWWAEYYVEPQTDAATADPRNAARSIALQAAALTAIAEGGAGTAFYWNPQKRHAPCDVCLWNSTGTARASGGTLPMMGLLRSFDREFPPGSVRRPVRVTGAGAADVRVLADDRAVLVVNTRDRPVRVAVDGRDVRLRGYQVRWLTRG
ncbi:xylan 1,4-beta-xylosidase, partial [Streptomyces zinciresistens K42]